jgi:hypothetical protein
MSFDEAFRLLIRRPVVITSAGALLGTAALVIAEDSPSRDIVTAFSELKLEKGSPNGSTSISGVRLRDDPQTGRYSVLGKFTKGTTNKHFHTYTEEVVLLKGTVIPRGVIA